MHASSRQALILGLNSALNPFVLQSFLPDARNIQTNLDTGAEMTCTL